MIDDLTALDQSMTDEFAMGWHADPEQLHKLRYHDGVEWTDHVTHFGPTPCSGCRQG